MVGTTRFELAISPTPIPETAQSEEVSETHRWGLADWGTASIAACLYTLNATILVLHRLARMEPWLNA
jgi:hypothetical protein